VNTGKFFKVRWLFASSHSYSLMPDFSLYEFAPRDEYILLFGKMEVSTEGLQP
jgi:hypothetical protein